MFIHAWWSFALVVVSRFYVFFGLPLVSAEGSPTFYYRRRRGPSRAPWIKEYMLNSVEIGGLRFRLDEFVSSKLPEGDKALRVNCSGWTLVVGESDSSRGERIELPVRAWYVPSTRLLVRVEWPVWAQLRKLDLLEKSFAESLRGGPEVNTPREQARIREFYHQLESLRASLQPGVPEEARRKAEERLDLLAFCSEWGLGVLEQRHARGKRR
jgi:hypothetical protein